MSLTIREISESTTSWFAKVKVCEKTEARFGLNNPCIYQHITLMDSEGQKICAVLFESDIALFQDKFQLYHTYKISNAKVKKVEHRFNKYDHPFQWIIHRGTCVCPDENDEAISEEDDFVFSYNSSSNPIDNYIPCSIAQIIAQDRAGKYFEVKVEVKIIDANQKFFYIGCRNCDSAINAAYNYTYDCFVCKEHMTTATPREKFILNIFDDTGSLDVAVFGAQATEIMQMDAFACMEMYNSGMSVDIGEINKRVEGTSFIVKLNKRECDIGYGMQFKYSILSMQKYESYKLQDSHNIDNINFSNTTQFQMISG